MSDPFRAHAPAVGHPCPLTEAFWDAESHTATERFHVVDTATGEVTRHALSTVAYSEDNIVTLATDAGFQEVVCHPSSDALADECDNYSFAVVART